MNLENNNKKVKTNLAKNKVFYIGISLAILVGVFFGYHLLSGNKTYFLSGDTSHGHYQIEVDCNACHVKAFAGKQEMQDACESCHGEDLNKVNDSHPRSVFTDPRNAESLSQLDARYCVTCHREHKPEITRDYGVTLAKDFCFHCHSDIAEERKSHQSLKFEDCTTSGCHNFHDNTMLYEKFLVKHISDPELSASPFLAQRTGLKRWLKKSKRKEIFEVASPDIQEHQLVISQNRNKTAVYSERNIDAQRARTKDISATKEWQSSIHSKVDTNCSSCHLDSQQAEKLGVRFNSPQEQCADCHKMQQSSFLLGKHGMRLSMDLSPMSTDQARIPVSHANGKLLSCSSCHNPHSLNVQEAALEACLGCHKDEHSKNYKSSEHFKLWQAELNGTGKPGSGVSCASCHLPRIKKGKNVTVVHNQNSNLRPSTKMLRKVCMSCHGLKFSLSALTDQKLIRNNFQGRPEKVHPTFKLIEQRMIEKKRLIDAQF